MSRWILEHSVLLLVLSAILIGLFNLDNLQGWLPGTQAPDHQEATEEHALNGPVAVARRLL